MVTCMSTMLYLQNLPGISPLQSWLLFAKSNAVDLPCPEMHVVCKIDYFFFEIISGKVYYKQTYRIDAEKRQR